MKTTLSSQRHRGAALIIVLSILTIMVALVLAFFAMVQTERVASASFSESVEVRNLSEIPVNLAITQLRKATENTAPIGTETAFKSWASQPGMIRVYGVENDGSGYRSRATALYKLYSDDLMVVSNANATGTSGGLSPVQVQSALKADTDDLMNWNSRPGLFTDLNEPVPVPGANPEMRFPIADPRASIAGSAGHAVDGFSYDVSKVAGSVSANARNDIKARLPMPVRWIYVLQDGSLVTPSAGDSIKSTFTDTGAGIPTLQNPIVGRVAFWTDDDTAKVNINTASEGSHWDVPIATSSIEKEYGTRVPAQNEFSRYPGHPAATSLSTVFQAFGNQYYVDSALAPNVTVFENLHRLSPRTPWGGTMAGTRETGTLTSGLPPKNDRLYASVDELFFDPTRDRNLPGVDASSLEISKFFLTASSRAPELNVFGKPRISLWPQSKNRDQRNPKDKILAFMSETTGTTGRQWYWMREANFTNPDNQGSSQQYTGDYPGTQRNDSMVGPYFMGLTGGYDNTSGIEAQMIPGFGIRSFRDKYGAKQRNQLAAEMFDLMRWGVNSYSSLAISGWPSYTYLPDRVGNKKGESAAVPLRVKDSKGFEGRGFGRWPTVTEAVIVFARVKEGSPAIEKLQAYILLEPFMPAPGPASMAANIVYQITGMEGFKVAFNNDSTLRTMGFNGKMRNLAYHTHSQAGYAMGHGSTPYSQFIPMLSNGDKVTKTLVPGGPGGTIGEYPFVSIPIEIPSGASTFNFSGGNFVITIEAGANQGTMVQKINMSLPAATFKVPVVPAHKSSFYDTLVKRFAAKDTNYPDGRPKWFDTLIMAGDIVRSVEVNTDAAPKGDLRVYCAMEEVPASWFKVADDYADMNVERRQFLRIDDTASNGQFGPHSGALPSGQNWGEQSSRQSAHNTAGTLLKDFMYARGAPPAVTRGLNGAYLNVGTLGSPEWRPGDWDNGVGVIGDGPYIRKPDEGNSINSPYFSRHGFDKETGASYSPNRQIASAVQFGSMSTGINFTNATDIRPWQTLLFSPNPASRTTPADQEPEDRDHPGFKAPRDHLMLDFFWMPITEPYAISEPFSTAGKVNMNYQMVPFTNIERSTGVKAVLKSARITAITPESGGSRKPGVETSSSASGSPYNRTGVNVYKNSGSGDTHKWDIRYAVNADITLQGFKQRFDKSDIFRSASEICEIFLVPKKLAGKTYDPNAPSIPTSYSDMTRWWNGGTNLDTLDAFELTGDNSREMPYNHIYPRLTTRSNTYTVHYRVQTLNKARSTPASEWVEGRDTVASEFRGSASIERYLDPNEKQVANVNIGLGSNNFAKSWDRFYRVRVAQRKQFVP